MSFSPNSVLRQRAAARARLRLGALLSSLRVLRWLVAVWVALTLLLIGWAIADSRPRVNASPNPPPSTWSRSGRAQPWQHVL